MSKVIKQMEMDALRGSLEGVRDLVVLSITGLSCQSDHNLRSALRKKNIRLRVVKNSLTRRVFGELGLAADEGSPFWTGPTALAWGANSAAELAQAINSELTAPKTGAQYKDKVAKKGALVDGQPVTFEAMLKMPTRAEALGRIVTLALSPASRIVGALLGPASKVASQVNTIKDREEPAAPAEQQQPA
jgi:large subunit ribosomal protein L10